MTATASMSKIIRTEIKLDERGVYVATSADLSGFLVVSKDKSKLEQTLIPQAIADLYKACGVSAVITPVELSDGADGWVAIPAALARRKLEELEPARS
jgi:hypothetical protein